MSLLGNARIRQIAIVCIDVARATTFYRDTLGVPFLFAAGAQLAFFELGGIRLMLAPAEGDVTGTSVLYFLVDDIADTMHSLRSNGVTFIGDAHMIARMSDHELWLAEFRDSEGNVLALMEERR